MFFLPLFIFSERPRLLNVQAQLKKFPYSITLEFSAPVHHSQTCGTHDTHKLSPQSVEVKLESATGDLLGFVEISEITPVSQKSHHAGIRLPFPLQGGEILVVTVQPSWCYDATLPCEPLRQDSVKLVIDG
jgi:hypothetical protein